MNDIKKIKLVVIDVDGTLTDAGIYYDTQGNELKKFSTRDAAGFWALQTAGIKTMVLTGRESAMVTKRMQELKVDYCIQNIKNKKEYLESFLQKEKLEKENVMYIGDDVNDLASMHLAGLVACPSDACQEVKQLSGYVSVVAGGNGVVRDVVETLFRDNQMWDKCVNALYSAGI